MADRPKPKHTKMYSGSPTIGADESGKKVIKRAESTQEEATNSAAAHDAAMLEMTQKHSTERLSLHQKHEQEMLQMMHQKAATVGGVETGE